MKRNLDIGIGLKNFFSIDNAEIYIIINEPPYNIEDIEIRDTKGYVIKSLEIYEKNKSKLILNKLANSKTLNSLRIVYKDNLNQFHNINIFFYSTVIDLKKAYGNQKFIYDRSQDWAPPILKMTSLQVGDFVVCNKENDLSYRFENAIGFYLLFSSISEGVYTIAEIDCTDTLFEIEVK